MLCINFADAGLDHRFHKDEPQIVTRQLYKAAQIFRQQNHTMDKLFICVGKLEQHALALIVEEGERVRWVQCRRRQQWQNIGDKMRLQPFHILAIGWHFIQNQNIFCLEGGNQ